MAPELPKVLVVDDDTGLLKALCRILSQRGFEAVGATRLRDAIRHMRDLDGRLGAVIVDLSLGRESGMTLVRHLRRRKPYLPVIIFTAFGNWDVYGEALGLGVNHFLSKPADPAEVVQSVRAALDEARAARNRSAPTV